MENILQYFTATSILNESFLQIEIVGRCILAALCGALIGIERKNRSKEAGLRTHLIVALGAALMMAVSKYGFFDVVRYGAALGSEVRLDPSRVASTIITGIGFLGAGTIFIRKQVINGLTTAAGLWTTAGIGMTIGAGMYFVGIAITIFQFLVQIFLHKNIRIFRSPTSDIIFLRAEDTSDVIRKVTDAMKLHNIEIQSIKYERLPSHTVEIECFVRFPKKYTLVDAAKDLSAYDFIKSVET